MLTKTPLTVPKFRITFVPLLADISLVLYEVLRMLFLLIVTLYVSLVLLAELSCRLKVPALTVVLVVLFARL